MSRSSLSCKECPASEITLQVFRPGFRRCKVLDVLVNHRRTVCIASRKKRVKSGLFSSSRGVSSLVAVLLLVLLVCGLASVYWAVASGTLEFILDAVSRYWGGP